VATEESVPTTEESTIEAVPTPPKPPKSLLPPPSTLISETIARYKGDQSFKDVFFPKGEEPEVNEATDEETASFLQQSEEVPEIISEDPFNIADEESETPTTNQEL
jgi:hypothetical protein